MMAAAAFVGGLMVGIFAGVLGLAWLLNRHPPGPHF